MELHRQGRGSGGVIGVGDRRRRLVAAGVVADVVDGPFDHVDVVEVAAGSDLEVDQAADLRRELLACRRIRQPVRAGRHEEEALPRVVGEEEAVVVVVGVRPARVEDRRRDRTLAARVAAATGHGLLGVGVAEERLHLARRDVQVLADRQVQFVPARLVRLTLVAGPSEVVDGAVGGVRQDVDLLARPPADIADPDLVRSRPERVAERVAQAFGDDATRNSRPHSRPAGCPARRRRSRGRSG